MMNALKQTALLISVAAWIVVYGGIVQVQASWQVNLFSDAHFDPAYGKSNGYGACNVITAAVMGQKGCDSPEALIKSTVEELTAHSSDMSIYAGDWQRHDFGLSGLTAADVFTPFSTYVMSIKTTGRIPSPAFAGSWGNNDVDPDYFFNTTASTQPELQTRAQLMEAKGLLTAADTTTFSKCAYFTRETDNVSVVVLNTLIWSTSAKPAIADSVTDPCDQFSFLKSQIANARTSNKKVIIVGHIPPVLDAYTVLQNTAFSNEETDMFWKSSFQREYEGIIAANKDVVKLQIFGHTHLFGIFAFANVGVPSIILPAISPLFGNTPAYMLSTFSDNWDLQEMQMHYLTISGWAKGMDVKGALGLQNGFNDIAGLQASLYALYSNDRMWNNYMLLHSGGILSTAVYPGGSCNAFCRAVATCMMVNNTHADIQNCVKVLNTAIGVEVNLSGSIVTAVLLLGVVIAVSVILALYQLIPKIRAGGLKFSKFDFDIRAELLNATPKKEKARRKVAADERRAAAVARYREERYASQFSPMSPSEGPAAAVSAPPREGDETVSVPVAERTAATSYNIDLDRAGFVDDHHRGRE